MTDTKDVRERSARALESEAVRAELAGEGGDPGYWEWLADAALSTLTLADHIAAVETAGAHAVVPVEPTPQIIGVLGGTWRAAGGVLPGKTMGDVMAMLKTMWRDALAARPRDVE